ncbi:radical SAM protein [bacterium]|nr:radical SAM protein [bacterium]
MPEAVVHSRLEDDLIIPPTGLELIAVDHCNVSCKSCNHGSPALKEWSADPDVVLRNLSILAKYYRPRFIKVLGGEPLLHRNLLELIRAARASGISDYFLLLTNGVLLHEMTDDLWQEFDEVEISMYPGLGLSDDNLTGARQRARRFGKKLTVNTYDFFRPTFSLVGTNDEALVRKIYSACKIANCWGCHAIYQDYFYKCAQSICIPRLVEQAPDVDGVEIRDVEGFQAELLAFVNAPTPLASCKHCVGTVGKQEEHTQIPRSRWKIELDQPTEDLIDYDWMEHSLVWKDCHDDCKIPTDLGWDKAARAGSWWQRVLRRN